MRFEQFFKRKYKFIFIIIAIILIILKLLILKFYFNFTVLKHECDCFRNKILTLKKFNDSNYLIEYDEITYRINSKLPVLTCNLFKSLKRGPNQKVVSFSLYGRNIRYYKLIFNLTSVVKKFYPDHVMRIYHDNTIDRSIICELECSYSHVEFCDIHKLPISFHNLDLVLDLSYIHSMMWRFVSIGDHFVDLFMSRDSDSMILQRECDSVQEWINSDKIGHIMRDHPQHGTPILGGMWSFKNSNNRQLADDIYKKIINKKIGSKYNPNGNSKKGYDQYFLSDYVYKLIKNDSTIHDSYLCKKYSDSKPFPSKRIGNCFVGRSGVCNETAMFTSCPEECRPLDHQDWLNC